MTMLVHLVDSSRIKVIKRSGIRGQEWSIPTAATGAKQHLTIDRAVFAMPVLPNFYASHQWLRELKRSGMRTISAVYFRMRSDSLVWVGRYNREHRRVPLGHAAGLIMHMQDPRGWQIVIPRSIDADEVHACKDVPQIVGWRYFPESHVDGPWKCACEYCLRGLRGGIKVRKLRDALIAESGKED